MESDSQPAENSSPFEPQAADLGGCGKPAVVGCLVVAVVLAVAFVVFLLNIKDMLGWALSRYEDHIVANLSDEVTEDERQRLVLAFEAARTAIDEERIDPNALQSLQRFMAASPGVEQPFGPDTVRELTQVLEAIGKPAVGLPDEELSLPSVEPGTTAARHPYLAHATV